MADLFSEDPIPATHDEDEDGFQQVLEEDPVQAVVDEADPTTFDNRTEIDDPLHLLDGSLTLHGGEATDGHPGVHDIDDLGAALDDLGDLLS